MHIEFVELESDAQTSVVLADAETKYLSLYSHGPSSKTALQLNLCLKRTRDLIQLAPTQRTVTTTSEASRAGPYSCTVRVRNGTFGTTSIAITDGDMVEFQTIQGIRMFRVHVGKMSRKRTHVAAILEDLTCSICHEVIANAHLVHPCGDTFCRECIYAWLATNKTCPLCRTSVRGHVPNRAVNGVARRLLSDDALTAWETRNEK